MSFSCEAPVLAMITSRLPLVRCQLKYTRCTRPQCWSTVNPHEDSSSKPSIYGHRSASLGGAWLLVSLCVRTTDCPGLATKALSLQWLSVQSQPNILNSTFNLAMKSLHVLFHINITRLSHCSCKVNNRVLGPKFLRHTLHFYLRFPVIWNSYAKSASVRMIYTIVVVQPQKLQRISYCIKSKGLTIRTNVHCLRAKLLHIRFTTYNVGCCCWCSLLLHYV